MPRRTPQKQITMDYGRVRLWGSIAFVIGSALVGKLVSLYDYRAILALLSIGIASMLLGMLLRPSVMPQGKVAIRRARAGPHGGARRTELAFSGVRVPPSGAHAAYYGFSAIYWQGRDIPLPPWAICGRWAWWPKSLSLP